MKKSLITWLSLGGVILSLLGLVFVAPATAAPEPQYTSIPTPTPGPDGRIIYIVQEGDTLWRISAITGISLEELRRLNDLAENDIILPGDRLLLGLGDPSDIPPTAGPAPTPTSDIPTPTPMVGVGIICVSVFDDTNGDALRQEEEPDLAGSAISISNLAGTVSLSQGEGGGLVPRCYEDVVLGIYDIPEILQNAFRLCSAPWNWSKAITIFRLVSPKVTTPLRPLIIVFLWKPVSRNFWILARSQMLQLSLKRPPSRKAVKVDLRSWQSLVLACWY